MAKKNKNLDYKFTHEYWNKVSKNEHYFKEAPPFIAEFKSLEYLNFLKDINLKNLHILKTDLYVEAKNNNDNFLPYLKDNYFTGIDISLETAKSAKKNLHRILPMMKFVVADVRHLPFKDAIFDAVISDSTLDHIPKKDLAIAITALRRVLKEDGKLILSLCNIFNFLIAVSKKIRYIIDKKYFFSYSLNYKNILSLVENIGFRIVEIKFIFPFHIFESILIKILYEIKFTTFLAKRWFYLVNMIGKLPLLDRFLCAQFIILANKK